MFFRKNIALCKKITRTGIFIIRRRLSVRFTDALAWCFQPCWWTFLQARSWASCSRASELLVVARLSYLQPHRGCFLQPCKWTAYSWAVELFTAVQGALLAVEQVFYLQSQVCASYSMSSALLAVAQMGDRLRYLAPLSLSGLTR